MSTLYIVATPIGHLEDASYRSVRVLSEVDKVVAEDTRRTQQLLSHYAIRTPLLSLHDWNESARAPQVIQWLEQGQSVALVSDAGTPLISDPGFILVRMAREKGLAVVPIPGPCALIAALSVAGLPTNQFVFEGFLPAKGEKRTQRLKVLAHETRTLVLYESCHRIEWLTEELSSIFGPDRMVCLARELTKNFETVLFVTAETLRTKIAEDPMQRKGEFVVIVAGCQAQPEAQKVEGVSVLRVLMRSLSVKQSAQMAHEITGIAKNLLYQWALEQAAERD